MGTTADGMIVIDTQGGIYRRGVLIVAFIYWAAVFIGTHLPSDSIPQTTSDKTLHFVAYCGLAILVSWAALLRFGPPWSVPARVLGVLALYAAFDEWTQTFVAGRDGDVRDWLADIGGSLVGVGMVYAVMWMRGRRPISRLQRRMLKPREHVSEKIGP